MTSFWRKATSPTSVEDTARIVLAKHGITAELRRAVKELQLNFIGQDKPICYGEEVESLCHTLEAVFIHGLKYSFARKMSSIFNNSHSDQMPDPDFWPVVMVYSHKQVLSQITKLHNISSDVGRCRSWIRIALNEGLLKSYIDSLIMDKSTLNTYYISDAYLSDSEQPFIMRQFIEGLEVFQFQLSYNSVYLNSWSPEPLLLAGIWNPPESPEPVMPAEDAVEFLTRSLKKSSAKPKKSKKVSMFQPSLKSQGSQTADDGATTTSSSLSETISNCDDGFSAASSLSNYNVEKFDSSNVEDNEVKLSSSQPAANDDEFKDFDNAQHLALMCDSSPHSVPGFEHMFVEVDAGIVLDEKSQESPGNKVTMKNSWSSSFETNTSSTTDPEALDSQSYDSIFQSYARNKPALHILAGTPELGDNYLRSRPSLDLKSESDYGSTESAEVSPDLSEFEIVPKGLVLSSKNTDESTQKFLEIFLKICTENGLDVQNYKCKQCNCYIGMIYGTPHLCVYDGAHYCSDCHVGDEHYIPSRILYNWDFRKHPVSKKAKEFLNLVQEEPLIDIRKQNPQLYSVVHELVEIQHLRSQLGFLRSYLCTCKEDTADQFRKLLWPREYLFEHIHLYSLSDLLQIPNGTLAHTLHKVIQFAKKHVLKCPLCSQKGFICEICNSCKIIYPFEIESTYHCENCLGVYHVGCMDKTKLCPKCERRKKRRSEKTDELWSPFN